MHVRYSPFKGLGVEANTSRDARLYSSPHSPSPRLKCQICQFRSLHDGRPESCSCWSFISLFLAGMFAFLEEKAFVQHVLRTMLPLSDASSSTSWGFGIFTILHHHRAVNYRLLSACQFQVNSFPVDDSRGTT